MEKTGKGTGFLSEVCDLREAEAWKIARPGIRVVVLRAGITVIAGSGFQWLSWIHLQDIVSIYGAAPGGEAMRGFFNAVSPFPVIRRPLAGDLARTLRRGFAPRLHAPPALIGFLAGKGAWRY